MELRTTAQSLRLVRARAAVPRLAEMVGIKGVLVVELLMAVQILTWVLLLVVMELLMAVVMLMVMVLLLLVVLLLPAVLLLQRFLQLARLSPLPLPLEINKVGTDKDARGSKILETKEVNKKISKKTRISNDVALGSTISRAAASKAGRT